jgi:hypothetical protein
MVAHCSQVPPRDFLEELDVRFAVLAYGLGSSGADEGRSDKVMRVCGLLPRSYCTHRIERPAMRTGDSRSR